MSLDRRRWLAGCGAALLGSTARAQPANEWPSRPVRLFVGFPPGGGVDLLARTLADKLGPALGQPIVIENRPGKAAGIATEAGAKAAPDGYTLLMANIGTMTLNPAIYPDYGIDPRRDVAPISRLVTYSLTIFVPADLPVRTLPELVALAKAKPGQLNYGSAGNGGITHIAGELFKRAAGVDMVHVPYKGSAPAMTDLAAGRIHMQIDIQGVGEPFVRSGRVRALAGTSAQRSPLAPDLPTAQEQGVPFVLSGWQAMVAPAATPPAIVQRLNAELRKALSDPQLIQTLAAQGNQASPSSPQELAALIATDHERMGRLIRSAEIKAD